MDVQLPRRPYPGRPYAEQPFHHRHAGQRRWREGPPGLRWQASTVQDLVALRPVKGREVELSGQCQDVKINSVLERIARQPHRSRAQHDEAMPKSGAQGPQPGAAGVVGEYHEHR